MLISKQESYEKFRKSWKKDDFGANLLMRNDIDRYIQSTKMKHEMILDNANERSFKGAK